MSNDVLKATELVESIIKKRDLEDLIVSLKDGAKADLIVQCHAKKTCAIHLAVSNGNVELIKAMIEICGPQILLAVDSAGRIALHYAAQKGLIQLVKMTLHEMNVNKLDNEGNSPVFSAMSAPDNKRNETITFLVQRGAKIDIRNNENMTCFEYARNSKRVLADDFVRKTVELRKDIEQKEREALAKATPPPPSNPEVKINDNKTPKGFNYEKNGITDSDALTPSNPIPSTSPKQNDQTPPFSPSNSVSSVSNFQPLTPSSQPHGAPSSPQNSQHSTPSSPQHQRQANTPSSPQSQVQPLTPSSQQTLTPSSPQLQTPIPTPSSPQSEISISSLEIQQPNDIVVAQHTSADGSSSLSVDLQNQMPSIQLPQTTVNEAIPSNRDELPQQDSLPETNESALFNSSQNSPHDSPLHSSDISPQSPVSAEQPMNLYVETEESQQSQIEIVQEIDLSQKEDRKLSSPPPAPLLEEDAYEKYLQGPASTGEVTSPDAVGSNEDSLAVQTDVESGTDTSTVQAPPLSPLQAELQQQKSRLNQTVPVVKAAPTNSMSLIMGKMTPAIPTPEIPKTDETEWHYDD